MAKIKSRSAQVMRDNNVKRFASYTNFSQDQVTKLEKAFEDDDQQQMAQIIGNNTEEYFVPNLMKVYRPVIKEMAKKILDANAHKLSPGMKRLKRAGKLKPKIKPVTRKNVGYATRKQVTQKQKVTGKIYSRSKPTRFSKRELTFLSSRTNLNNKDLIKQYNYNFAKRSGSSIVTKKYRLKRSKTRK